MRAILSILSFSLVIFLGSCSKTCYCSIATLFPAFVAFDSTETDTLMVVRYPKNAHFSGVLDTTILTAKNADYRYHNDTLFIRPRSEAGTLRSFYDYVLYLPSLNRRDSLEAIDERQETQEGGHSLVCHCINGVYSFHLNRDTIKIPDPALPVVSLHR
ncbi:MAG: hypothetical protein ACXVMS_15175 [Flavisolibacter sp.]